MWTVSYGGPMLIRDVRLVALPRGDRAQRRGVGRTEAATYSIALYLVAYVPKVVLGALVTADPSWRPSMNWTPNA